MNNFVEATKLDLIAKDLRERSGADGIVIVMLHSRGLVFAAAAEPTMAEELPHALSYIAHDLARQLCTCEDDAPESKAN